MGTLRIRSAVLIGKKGVGEQCGRGKEFPLAFLATPFWAMPKRCFLLVLQGRVWCCGDEHSALDR